MANPNYGKFLLIIWGLSLVLLFFIWFFDYYRNGERCPNCKSKDLMEDINMRYKKVLVSCMKCNYMFIRDLYPSKTRGTSYGKAGKA